MIGVTQNAVRTLECSEHVYGTIANDEKLHDREARTTIPLPGHRGAREPVEVIA